MLAAAASQMATKSSRIVAYTQKRKLPLTLSLELQVLAGLGQSSAHARSRSHKCFSGVAQPLFNTTKAIPLLIWTFDATEETSQRSTHRAPGIAAAQDLPDSGTVLERAGCEVCQTGPALGVW